MSGSGPSGRLGLGLGRVLTVLAHPDDESFGLGGVIGTLVEAGTEVDLWCLTAGESSTLGLSAGESSTLGLTGREDEDLEGGPADDLDGEAVRENLAARRARELAEAVEALGIRRYVLRRHPDGALDAVDRAPVVEEVAGGAAGVDALLTFDRGGVSGHPDHEAATEIAIAVGERLGLPVLGWVVPEVVAARLRAQFGLPFVGVPDAAVDITLQVDRARQQAAMACHRSQLGTASPVPRERTALLGDREHLRWLVVPDAVSPGGRS